jgi:membrane-bound ClpP family serine protease
MTALGVSLLIVGAIVVLIEAHVPAYGMLGIPGVAALAVGAVLAISGLGGGVVLGILAAVVLASVGLGMLAISLRKGLAVRRGQARESLIGHIGVVREWSEPTGRVLVDGALWHAQRSLTDEEHDELHKGDSIVVERRSGLTLSVRPAEDWELVR